MNERQKKLLNTLVKIYTETVSPVGSEAVLKHSRVSVSAATIRNDLHALEKGGYLHQPHTSAGRIPTDKAYRFYVEELMGPEPLSKKDERALKEELLKLQAKHARTVRTTAKLLSHLSGNLAISGIPGRDEFYEFGIRGLLENPEFHELDELSRVVEILDTLDERIDALLPTLKDGQTQIYIGKENPIQNIDNCSMIVSPYRRNDGERGILAIIGPKRMEYARNKSLIEHMRKLLSSSLAFVLIVQGTHTVIF